MRFKDCLVVLLAILFLPGCYQMVKRDTGGAFHGFPLEAQRYRVILERKSEAASDFKAIGKVRLWDGLASRTSRAAWLGTTDGRLRIEFLGLPGQPVAKFIFDGHRFLFFSGIDQQVYKRKSTDPDLAPVTGISIKTSEVLACLSGGLPLYTYDTVSLENKDGKNNAVLIFKKNWLGVVEKIFFNGSVIKKLQVFRWGKKVYQITFEDIRQVNGRQIPYRLVISNGKGQGFSFTSNRYWSDIKIPPTAFENMSADE